MKQNDFTTLTVILCLVLALAFDVVFYSYNAIEKIRDKNWIDSHKGLIQIFNSFPVTFLSIAIVINTRNWNYYYLKIKEAAFVNSLSTEFLSPIAEKAQENMVKNFHKK
jgi:hypothetical protein